MSWGHLIIASVIVSAIWFGIFLLLRLRAEPVEDEDDQVRVSSIEGGLGLRKLPHQRNARHPSIQTAPALLPRAIALGDPAL